MTRAGRTALGPRALAWPQPQRGPGLGDHAGLGWALLHLGVMIAAVAASLVLLRYDEEQAFFVATGAATYIMGVAFYRGYRLTGDAINGLSISMLIMLMLYPLHGVVMRDSEVVVSHLGSQRYEYFTYALWVAIPGTWFMYRGFVSGRAGVTSRLVERLTRIIDDRSPAVEKKLTVLVAVAVLARMVQVAQGTGTYVDLEGVSNSEGSSGHFILGVFGSTSLLVGLYLLATGARFGMRRRSLAGVAVILMEAVWGGLFSGSRYQLFVPILSAVAVYSLAVRALKLKRLVVVLALFFLVFFPIATAYRNTYLSNIVDLQREGLSASVVVNSLRATDVDEPMAEGWAESIALRFHALTSLALIIRYTPERHPYLLGVPYALLPLDILVPRFIWPDKPALRQFALDFRFDYFNLERGTRTAVKPSQFGELWVNLHIFGVLLGAWVWGRILRLMYSFLYLGGRASLFSAAAYAAALPSLVSALEGELVTGISYVVKNLVIWIAWTWFLGERRLAEGPHPGKRDALGPRRPDQGSSRKRGRLPSMSA